MSYRAITKTSGQAIHREHGMPLIGCLPEFAKDPLTYFKKLSRLDKDIVEINLPMIDAAVVCNAEIAREVLIKSADKFKKSDRDVNILSLFLGNGLITNTCPESHRKQKQQILPGFHIMRFESYAKVAADYTKEVTADWIRKPCRDVTNDIFQITLYATVKTLFGTEKDLIERQADDISQSVKHLQAIVWHKLNQLVNAPTWMPTLRHRDMNRSRTILYGAIRSMMKERTLADGTIRPGEDLLTTLMSARQNGECSMSDELLLDELVTLFVAGHETTSSALGWTLYLLGSHPDIQTKLFSEISNVYGDGEITYDSLRNLEYCEMVIKESMRIYPPVWLLTDRQALSDIQIDNYHIPKDKNLIISPFIFHHNEKYFNNPEAFDPERFSKNRIGEFPKAAYMPFSMGKRACIGAALSMIQMKMVLANIVKTYEFRVAANHKLELTPQITLSNKQGLNLNIFQRVKIPEVA